MVRMWETHSAYLKHSNLFAEASGEEGSEALCFAFRIGIQGIGIGIWVVYVGLRRPFVRRSMLIAKLLLTKEPNTLN